MASQTQLLHSSGQPYFDVFGPQLQFLNTPEQTGNRFCFMKAILPPGVAIPLHRHPDPETLYVADGSLEFLHAAALRRLSGAALNHLRSQGTDTKPEDVARLSPLADKHFNVLGRYRSK